MNFTDFLIYTRLQLANLARFRLISVVMGNESCDLDSTISACVYAYFLHMTCSNKNEILHIPIMNTNESTFRLRTEVRWFLKENFFNVVFINEINLNELYDQHILEIILVDHHSLRSKLNEVVVEIIDHHQIQKNSICLQNSSAIKIEPVGSCCTLIAQILLSSSLEMNDEIAYLLTGPILFDTVNFSPTAGKATEKDREIYAELQAFRQPPIDDAKLFSDLKTSASDTTGLSVGDLLQKDAKQAVGPNIRLIMSSLPINYTVEKLIEELKTVNDLNEFLTKNENVDGVIMTSIEGNNEQTKRQLGFYMKNIEYMKPLSDCLQSSELNLNLHERSIPINNAQIKLFDQYNVQASRKQILPFIDKFVKNFLN